MDGLRSCLADDAQLRGDGLEVDLKCEAKSVGGQITHAMQEMRSFDRPTDEGITYLASSRVLDAAHQELELGFSVESRHFDDWSL